MRLGVVGHEQAKFTSHTEALARSAIVEVIERLGAHTLISGHCPLGGYRHTSKAAGVGQPGNANNKCGRSSKKMSRHTS